MRARAEVALGKTPGVVAHALPSEDADDEAEMVSLRRWYAEWAETAHAVVMSRAALIDLGLARRKRGDESSEAPKSLSGGIEPDAKE